VERDTGSNKQPNLTTKDFCGKNNEQLDHAARIPPRIGHHREKHGSRYSRTFPFEKLLPRQTSHEYHLVDSSFMDYAERFEFQQHECKALAVHQKRRYQF